MSVPAAAATRLSQLLDLCKRRGILVPSYALYNGLRGALDYGPLGVELKRAILNEWWRAVVDARDDVHGVDTPILTPQQVLQASGHESGFSDPLVDCRLTRERFRADKAEPLRVEEVVVAQDTTNTDTPTRQWRIPIHAPDKGRAREWEQLISERLAPGAKVTRNGRVVYVYLASRPEAPGVQLISADGQPIAMERSEAVGEQRDTHWLEVLPADMSAAPLRLPCPGYAEPTSNSPFLTEPRDFNLMFSTHIGAGEVPSVNRESASSEHHDTSRTVGTLVYLRPETAQGIFANFPLLHRAAGLPALPFGLAQYGKAFRNEIRTEKSVFRTCEFEQLELEYFVAPDETEAMKWLDRWKRWRLAWWRAYAVQGGQRTTEEGSNTENVFRLRAHASDELAHYARACFDVEYRFPWGWGEVEGIAHRGDYDLRQHAETIHSLSGIELPYGVNEQGRAKKGVPWVIESSAGLNRACLVYLLDAYTTARITDPAATETHRTYLQLHPRLAPIQVAVMPLLRRPELINTARDLLRRLRLVGLRTMLDSTGASIGRRYARQDEVGTPWCLTVDFDTTTDGCVTVRERDTMIQTRVPLDAVAGTLRARLDAMGFIPPIEDDEA
jgi:glycyl-tRNA synthetase